MFVSGSRPAAHIPTEVHHALEACCTTCATKHPHVHHTPTASDSATSPTSCPQGWSATSCGRCRVVLLTMRPSMPDRSATAATSLRSTSGRSGEILTSTGGGPRAGSHRTASLAARMRLMMSSSSLRDCSARKPACAVYAKGPSDACGPPLGQDARNRGTTVHFSNADVLRHAGWCSGLTACGAAQVRCSSKEDDKITRRAS